MYFFNECVRANAHKPELLFWRPSRAEILTASAGKQSRHPPRAGNPATFTGPAIPPPSPHRPSKLGLIYKSNSLTIDAPLPTHTGGMFISLNPAAFERISISEFRKAPGKALRNLEFGGLILYSHSRICGYVLNKRMLDNLRIELTRANRKAIDLAEILRVLHPDLLALRTTRPDLAVRIDSYLSAMIANHPEIRPPELVGNL